VAQQQLQGVRMTTAPSRNKRSRQLWLLQLHLEMHARRDKHMHKKPHN
jgi:hypothetical protein